MSVDTEWVFQTPDPGTVRRLVTELGVPEPVARAVANRGYTDPRSARRFLEPSPAEINRPSSLPDIGAAVERIEAALDRDETIAVYADRDVDGISGAAVLVTLLRDLEAAVEYCVPGKWDGYGLHADHVDELAASGTDLLLTVDCGTTALEEVGRANDAGLDVVVTDHHQPEERLPEAVACVNPRRDDSAYPHDGLAGGAVAFKLGQALVESRAPTRIERYHRYALPLAALATVGDYVPLDLENRAIVREGFDRLFDCGLVGLVETASHVGVESVRDVSWSLVPLLNAGQEAEAGEFTLEVLLERDPARCSTAIERLEGYREERRRERAERREHLRECVEAQIDPETADVLVVEVQRYVGGGAMSQLSEEWGRPVVTYRRRDGGYRGGGRTAPDVDLLEVFEASSDLLEEYWGHPGAAGFKVSPGNLEPFVAGIAETVRTRYEVDAFRPTVEIDGRLDPDRLDRSLLEELARLEPFGNGNAEPEYLLEGVEVARCEFFGDDERHCKLFPAGDAEEVAFTVVCWDGAGSFEDVVDGGLVADPAVYDIVGTLSFDDYAGTPQVNVTDYRRRE